MWQTYAGGVECATALLKKLKDPTTSVLEKLKTQRPRLKKMDTRGPLLDRLKTRQLCYWRVEDPTTLLLEKLNIGETEDSMTLLL